MKKIIFIGVCVIIIVSVSILFINFSKEIEPRCEDGLRFNPASQECVSIDFEKKEFDFGEVSIQIPDSTQTIKLQQGAQSNQYQANFLLSPGSALEGFVSLDASEKVSVTETLIVIPMFINTGGTGQFLYLGLFNTESKTHLSSVFIGDRMNAEAIEFKNNTIRVLSKARSINQSYATTPRIPIEIVLEIKDDTLIEIMRIENARYDDIELRSLPLVSKDGVLMIRGAIPGTWYFEAIANYRILNNEQTEIGSGIVQALSDWMTVQRVPFELIITTSDLQYKGKGTLIIEASDSRDDEESRETIKRMYIPVQI